METYHSHVELRSIREMMEEVLSEKGQHGQNMEKNTVRLTIDLRILRQCSGTAAPTRSNLKHG
jgi:hypothetical protein